jgi:hypothetical protein
VAALLTAAGCQHELGSRSPGLSSWSDPKQDFNGFLLGDTRQVTLNFEPPPVKHDMDHDMVFGYMSVPVHNGSLALRTPSFGIGYSNTAMTFSKLVVTAKGDTTPLWGEPKPENSLVMLPAWRPYPDRPRERVTVREPKVEARFAAYAASIRAEATRIPARLAIDRGTELRKDRGPVLGDDD